MPGKVKVKIISGRNLPVMDRSSDTTDAYVEIKLGTTTYKTDVCRKSLHPHWNSEWYRFEVDDAELQDEPLQIRLMDHDTYSANDAIGKVYLDLNPLLLPATSLLCNWNDGGNLSHEGNNSVMSGWIPVFDTMHGIRGEVNVVVKVELFSDFNKFRQSSCGVQFFCSQAIPHGFYAQVIHGFVEELVVNDDPEYQWIDKIRTPRASNEARQTLFFKLSGELQRKIGLKALEMGGNAVIGYNQCFDLEGESGIVARGIGTAVSLIKIMDLPSPNPETGPNNEERAQSYINFLGSAKGFYLHREPMHLPHKLRPHPLRIPSPSISLQSLKLEKRILKPERLPRHLLTRHLSDKEFNLPPSMHPEQVLHHSISLQTLLKQEDMRGKPGYGITQRFKNLKHSSQHMISRKMTALKAKLGSDVMDVDADEAEIKKRALLQYRRTQSDSTGMAEILVRSVFHAATSLDCIAESPKPSIDEGTSFLPLPSPKVDDSTSSIAESDDDDEDDDEDDDDDDDEDDEGESDKLEPLEELDSVVATVRKLSMIHVISDNSGNHRLGANGDGRSKFLFVIGDNDNENLGDSTSNIGEDESEENLLYYAESDAGDEKSADSESFFPQFAKAFGALKKTTTATSLSGVAAVVEDADTRSLSRKFTSLHNIHDAAAKLNKYSAHGGKETVLGELFRRIDNAPQSQPEIATIRASIDAHMDEHKLPCDIFQLGDLQPPPDAPRGAGNSSSTQPNSMEVINTSTSSLPGGQIAVQERGPAPKLFLPRATTVQVVARSQSLTPDAGVTVADAKVRTAHGVGFLPKKVMRVLHKLDAKLHHHKADKSAKKARAQSASEHLLFACRDSDGKQRDVNVSEESVDRHVSGRGMQKISECSYTSEADQEKSDVKDETQELEHQKHHHTLMERLKEGKDAILHAPKELFHKIDSKIHEHDDGKIKNEHGLINIALGNVLMDSVQDVLATSHSASPQSPVQPFFDDEASPKSHPEKVLEHSHVLDIHPNEEDSNWNQKSDLKDETHDLEHQKHHHTLMERLKEGKDAILHAPKELFHKIDSKIHEHDDGKIKNEHGLINIALGNVLMDSVQDVLATSHSASPQSPIQPFFDDEASPKPHPEKVLEHSHVLDIHPNEEDSNWNQKSDLKDETHDIEHQKHHHTLMERLKEGTDAILHAPKELFHKLDNKIHEHDDGRIRNEHGLINIALGNVLMDSVQDVLATSHSASPQSPIQPFFEPSEGNSSKKDEGDSQLEKFIEEDYKHRHTILEKLKEGKDAILHVPKDLLHKVHESNDGKIKNDHGLLNIALGNVPMDTVQDVLATSHSATPSSSASSPVFPTPTTKSNSIVPEESTTHPEIPTQDSWKFPVPTVSSETKLTDANIQDTKCLLLDQTHTRTSPSRHVNTEIDGGSRECINTQHACLTTPRNVEPPPTESRTETTTSSITTSTTTTTSSLATTMTAAGHQRTESLGVRISHSPAKLNSIPCIHRRSSDSDLSITPKGNSLTGSDRSGGYSSGQYMRGAMIRTTRPQENLDIMEYPFLTLSKYPLGFIAHIGGSVSARSVKLLERISNLEEPESRDTWWSEIRMEIRSHAKALNCNAVLGYTETTSICEDVCVLSASGTAAVLGFQYASETADNNVVGAQVISKNSATSSTTTSTEKNDTVDTKDVKHRSDNNVAIPKVKTVVVAPTAHAPNSPEREAPLKTSCSICHLPYFANSKPLRMSSIKCSTCGAFKVPDVLLATIEMPEGMLNMGRGCFIQSYVCRPLKDLKGESNAKEISDGLPFLEYELHRFLINKLKIKGMNAIFGLKVRISIGERMLIGIATGTAVFLSPLPPPLLPKLVSDRTVDEKKLAQLQKNLHDTIKRNREIYQLRSIEEVANGGASVDTDDSEDEHAALDLAMGNKDCCILEVDDPDDVDVLNSLMEPRPPDGFHVVNTEHVPGLEDLEIVKNLQMFTQIWRAKIPPPFNLDKHFHRLLQSVYFKLRRMIPCALCDLQFRVDSPEPDEIQLCVLGMALGLGDPFKNPKKRPKLPKRNDDDLIFNLEEDQIPEHSIAQTPQTTHLLHAQSSKHRQKSPIRNRILMKQRHVPYRERHGVDITPLSYVPGGKIEKYLGNLNFFFIRETTSLREEGGLSGFVHSFVTEVLAIVRAHVTALGGNAMVAYFITECVLNHNMHKNQGQCLINVGGDVVYVSYFNEEM